MAEKIFKKSSYSEREIDLSGESPADPVGVPATVIGTSQKGPAFVPVTVRDGSQFDARFGAQDPLYPGTYAAKKFLDNRQALTYVRVLGAGVLDDASSIAKYRTTGQVKNAGFIVSGTVTDGLGRHKGAVQLITARHALRTNEAFGMPLFSDNGTFDGTQANLVRGEVFCAKNVRISILDGNESAVGAFTSTTPDDLATVVNGKFKLILSSSDGASFGSTDGIPGVKIFSASLNPSDRDYYAKILNRDPARFEEFGHVLYADFPVDDEIATATFLAVVSGSENTSSASGDISMLYRDAFGHFDAKYTAPATPYFISQPFGKKEYDLFRVESLDDGEYANTMYKVSIADLKASIDETNPYGTFTLQIRDWNDNDLQPVVLESYPGCTLDPASPNYIARQVGDQKLSFLFDAESYQERRLVKEGRYEPKSSRVRVVMSSDVENKLVPASSLPFGFRGHSLLKTNNTATDRPGATNVVRLAGAVGSSTSGSLLSGSVLPPVPYRFKVTRGEVATTGFAGNPGPLEAPNANYYWGVKFERNTDPLNPNISIEKNDLLASYTKFAGIQKLDTLLTGSLADSMCENKFSLARVALSNASVAELTGSVEEHMREAAYLRNGSPDPSTYKLSDGILTGRLSFASLLADSSPQTFNRFSRYAKFTTFMAGGFDGLNILSREDAKMSDRATSFSGNAGVGYISPGLSLNVSGETTQNCAVQAYRMAVEIATEPLQTRSNLFTITGIREPYITDYLAKKVDDYQFGVSILDIENYDDAGNRIFADSTIAPDVDRTASAFTSRAIDNNAAAAYFPDVVIQDDTLRRRVRVPASVAALGAISFTDTVAKPWFAPAGQNRASLDYVRQTSVKFSSDDLDTLAAAKINPIGAAHKNKFVILDQLTLQASPTAFSFLNVKRLVVDLKRQVAERALKTVFENNVPEEVKSLKSDIESILALVKAQSGLEDAMVIMDSRNNSQQDKNEYRLRGKILLVPTNAFREISIDFIITRGSITFL